MAITPFSARRRLPEWMDQPGLDPDLHRDALRGLERINAVSGTVSAIWRPLAAAIGRPRSTPARVVDLACGAGDVAIGLARQARAEGVDLAVEGCDISATAVGHARLRARQHGVAVRFFEHDVLEPLGQAYDAVVCSLFLHHLDDEQAVRLLQLAAAAATSTVIVSDLERGRIGLVLAWLGTRLVSRSPVVHVDAIRSVHAAFTRAEARTLAARAGLESYDVTTHWPCRWRLVAEGRA